MYMQFNGKITLLSPMAHNSDESCGTDTKFRRMRISYNGDSINIPMYSGNAFRGIFRRIAARQFCELIGIPKGGLSDKLYYCWFTGGMLEKGSAQDYIEVGKKRELRSMIPFISLVGCAIQNQIVSGKMKIGIGMPVAKETEHLTGIKSDMTIWDMVDEIFYTRRDDLEDPKEEKTQAQQMKYSIECLAAGTILKHKIALEMVDEIEMSCFGYAMNEMIKIGVLGGKGATGHGQVRMEYAPEIPSGEKYVQFVKENLEKIKEYVGRM